MDLSFTPEEETFRREVREFMRTAMPPDIRETIEAGERANRDHMLRWQKILHAKGWGAASWPKEWGGPGWDPIRQHIFEEEAALAGAPRQLPFGLRVLEV